MKRSKKLQEKIDSFAEKAFGESLSKVQEKKICIFCKKEVGKISDYLTKKEYEISGICPTCQDGLFD